MFTTYRHEDDPMTNGVANRIASFMTEKIGHEVPSDLVRWEACVDGFSMYSAMVETEDDIIGVMVRKDGEQLALVEL